MNNFYLYRQITRGTWFIDPGHALSMGALLQQYLGSKRMDGERDWRNMPTQDLQASEGRTALPVMAGMGTNSLVSVSDFSEVQPGSVAVIPLKGTMIKYGTMCEYGTEEIAAKIIAAGEADNIEGIILDVDSGGGTVDSVPPLTDSITKVRNMMNKPVIALCDLCASAAYFASSYCDKIIAANSLSAHFGSIGVMTQFWDIVPFYEKEGYVFHSIYAPESNYKNLPFEKALKKDYSLMESEELSPLAIEFQNAVKKQRGNKLNMDVEGLLNGRMFYANNPADPTLNAKAVGLIDDTGNMDYAIELVLSMAEARRFTSMW